MIALSFPSQITQLNHYRSVTKFSTTIVEYKEYRTVRKQKNM